MIALRRKYFNNILFTKLNSRNFIRRNMNSNQSSNDKLSVNVHGETLKFPFVWLRDNCQCDQCFHTTAKSRIVDWTRFNVNVQPVNIYQNINTLQIKWNDGHESEYNYDWLKFRSFKPEDQKKYTEDFYKIKKTIWDAGNFKNIFTKHDYNNILKSDKALHDWLLNLSIYGVALVDNVPNRENAVDDIVDKICFTRRTHYGVKFIVQHVPNTNNVAYQSSNLPMHIDLPYYQYCPGINLLHSFVQTESQGGENLLTDGHYVAHYMKENHPKEYAILADTDVEWSDVGVEDGNEFYKLYREPVISLDKNGEIKRINFSIQQRGTHFVGDIDNVKPWYLAQQLFYNLAYKFAAKFKTKPGQMLVFDNIRLLHGRNAYSDNNNNVRKLIGAYFDWDEIYSRLRCLKMKLEGAAPSN